MGVYSGTSIKELQSMAHYMPELMNTLKYLTQNVDNINKQMAELRKKQYSEQRSRSQSNSSKASLASTITSFNDMSSVSSQNMKRRRHSTVPGAKREHKSKYTKNLLDAQKQSLTYNNFTKQSARMGPGNYSGAS